METTLTAAPEGTPTLIPTGEPVAGNYMVESPWTWRDRLRHKLMPRRFCPLPEAPGNWPDVIESHTIIGLDWKDRLRVLITGHLRVDLRIVTEHEAGATRAASVAYPIWKP